MYGMLFEIAIIASEYLFSMAILLNAIKWFNIITKLKQIHFNRDQKVAYVIIVIFLFGLLLVGLFLETFHDMDKFAL